MNSRGLYSIKEARELLGGISRNSIYEAPSIGPPSERRFGLQATHFFGGNRGAYREVHHDDQPFHGLRPIAHAEPEDFGPSATERHRQRISQSWLVLGFSP